MFSVSFIFESLFERQLESWNSYIYTFSYSKS